MNTRSIPFAILFSLFASSVWLLKAVEVNAPPAVSVKPDANGRLDYAADASGNRVIDFSSAGYGGGGEQIPLVPAKLVVAPGEGRDRERIQAALDQAATLPIGADGFRGAVLLAPGRFEIDGTLRLKASGVVLRGSGTDQGGTVLVSRANRRDTLIEVEGIGELKELAGTRREVAGFVAVGASRLPVSDVSGFAPGQRVIVRRPSTAAWIVRLGMHAFSGWRPQDRVSWAPGSRDLSWERSIVGVGEGFLALDAPITTAVDPAWGGGTVARCEFPGRIERVGVENLRCVAEYDRTKPQDEEHAWVCVSLDKVEHAWVRQVVAEHFVGHVVFAQDEARAVTIEDCTARAPVSEKAAYRRRSFCIGGQLILVQRCESEQGFRDFTTEFAASGPNVFLQCIAREAHDYSGPDESWASGVLYDNVVIRGNALRFLNRGASAQGAGWTAANSILWNCQSTELQVQSPPDAGNQAYGCVGLIVDDSLDYDPRRMPYRGFVRGGAVKPASLYLAQLAERKGPEAAARLAPATLPVERSGARVFPVSELPAPAAPPLHSLELKDAQFMIDGQRAFTQETQWSWFRAQMAPSLAGSFGTAITRFAPGRSGVGLTDRLEEVVAALKPGEAFVHHYGLWFDRRRINHNFYGSPELPPNDVTPPYMEHPWARSGIGTDWNGLSKYDLTRFNPWFFQRVKDFANLCDTNGRILYHNFYFQHAVQESRSHYCDFPWRPVNCLQDTGMPDENPAGSTFYDLSHPVRRDLHRRYIRHCLDVLKDNRNVVYGIDREYSGPLSFVQFWLDTIAEWQRENGRTVYIALEVPKAQMDVLLSDPVRRPLVSAVGFHHWFYRADGSLFAIEGGLNKAPREQLNAQPPTNRPGGPHQRYRALREYRDAYPDLVILQEPDAFTDLSAAIDRRIPAEARALTRPSPLICRPLDTSWCMAASGTAYLVYSMKGDPVELDLTGQSGEFVLTWIGTVADKSPHSPSLIPAGKPVLLTPPQPLSGHPCAVWLARP